jgi:hypothetical protein
VPHRLVNTTRVPLHRPAGMTRDPRAGWAGRCAGDRLSWPRSAGRRRRRRHRRPRSKEVRRCRGVTGVVCRRGTAGSQDGATRATRRLTNPTTPGDHDG